MKAKLSQFSNCVYSSLLSTKDHIVKGAHVCLVGHWNFIKCLATELQNPVVLLNVILGSGVITGLLNGYIKYEKRFLKGKTNNEILGCAGAAVALLTLDGFVSKRYYSKFDQKKNL